MEWRYNEPVMEIWIKFNLIHKSGDTAFFVANETDGVGYTGITNILDWKRDGVSDYVSCDSLGGYINDKYIGCVQGSIVPNAKQSYLLHLQSGVTDGKFEVYLNSILLYTYTGNVNNGHTLDGLKAYTDNESDNIFSDWEIVKGDNAVLQRLDYKPREAHVSFDFGGRRLQFHNGAMQIIRDRIRPRKMYELRSGGGTRSMNYLLDFYNAHQGAHKKFIYNYDGVDEVCVFSEKIQVEECRELDNIVGHNTTLQIEAVYDNVDIVRPTERENFPLKPRGTVTETVEWNTRVLDMGATGRQPTFDVPIRTFSIKLSGNRKDRDKFVSFLRSHGNHTAFYFSHNHSRIEVLFPQTVEFTDYIELGKVVGFSCELDLTELRRPNAGVFTSLPIVPADARRVSLREFTANGYYLQGEYADGICYKDCMHRLSEYKIIDCYRAFENSDLTELPYLDVSECHEFGRMFKNSKISKIREMDTSNGTGFNQMFYNSRITYLHDFDISKASSYYDVFSGSSIAVIENVILGKNGSSLFKGASCLQTIKSMNTSQTTSFGSMFEDCTMLFDIPTLDLGSATQAGSMFNGCSAIRNVRLMNTHNLTNVTYMFRKCEMLESVEGLDLSNAEVVDEWGHNEGIVSMFQHCARMTHLTVHDNISYDDAKRKYRLLMNNYGLFDGRYNYRYIKSITVVVPNDVYHIER